MKDLFVELATLHHTLGTASEAAMTLRTAMLTSSSREAALEQKLREQLLELSSLAKDLASEIQAGKIGINVIEAEDSASNSRSALRKKPQQKSRVS